MASNRQTIEEFLELDLLRAIGLGDASEEEKREFIDRARAEILGSVAKKVEEKLSPDKRAEFVKLFDDDRVSNAKREAFIRVNVLDFEEIVVKETLLFKKQALDAARGLNV